jgi:hypothetical protein
VSGTFNWHELAHKISYAERVVRELLVDLPATEQFEDLRLASLDFKMAAQHRMIVTPQQILNKAKENQDGG